jgi:hypothetical protein
MNDQQLPGDEEVARGRARVADVDLPSDEGEARTRSRWPRTRRPHSIPTPRRGPG